MKRFAILIGSPSHPSTPKAGQYLSGVKTDIENMNRFLSSSIGGSWSKDEIKVFPINPTYETVLPFLKYCETVDFAFVYFSGHGYTDANRKPRAVFNETEKPDIIKHLANRARRQITIIDACRSFPEYVGFDGVPLLEGINFPNPNPTGARKMYDDHLSKVKSARVLLFATSEGKPSMDYGNEYGGLFSNSLLSVAKNKILNENKPIFNVAEIFKTAQRNTQRNEPEQKPQIFTSDDRANNLPFAVKSNYRPQVKSYDKFVKKSLTEDIGKMILASAATILAAVLIDSLLNDNKK